MIELTRHNFEECFFDNKTPIIIDFYADWCSVCKRFMPMYKQIAERHPEITFYTVNLDRFPEVVREFNISSIPFFIGKTKGRYELRSHTGLPTEGILLDLIEP